MIKIFLKLHPHRPFMKLLRTMVLTLTITCALSWITCQTMTAKNPIQLKSTHWQNIIKNNLCDVLVEKKLYLAKTCPGIFFVHVSVANKTKRTIGIKYSDNFFFPIQWGIAKTDDVSTVFNGPHSQEPQINEETRKSLKSAYKTGQLRMIAPSENFSYYVNFNGNGSVSDIAKTIQKYGGGFVTISMDGNNCFVTDGSASEPLWCEAGTVVVIPTPINWQNIPDRAVVFYTGLLKNHSL